MVITYENGAFKNELTYSGPVVINFKGQAIDLEKFMQFAEKFIDSKDIEPNDGNMDFKLGEGKLTIDF